MCVYTKPNQNILSLSLVNPSKLEIAERTMKTRSAWLSFQLFFPNTPVNFGHSTAQVKILTLLSTLFFLLDLANSDMPTQIKNTPFSLLLQLCIGGLWQSP